MADLQEIILDEVRNVRAELQAHRVESVTRHNGIDTRVRAVENWQSDANGRMTMLGLVGVCIGAVATWFLDFVKD